MGLSHFPLVTIYNIKLDENYLFSENSYKVFYVKKKRQTYVQKTSGPGVMFHVSVSNKQFDISLDVEVGGREMQYEIQYPLDKDEYLTYTTKIKSNYWDFPLYVGYSFLSQKQFRLYTQGGITATHEVFYEETAVFLDEVRFEGLLYKENNYFSGFVGFGVKANWISIVPRYYIRLNKLNGGTTSISYFTICLMLTDQFFQLRRSNIYIHDED